MQKQLLQALIILLTIDHLFHMFVDIAQEINSHAAVRAVVIAREIDDKK